MFDWKKFIELGDELLIKKDEEYIRTAISRFYFGVFGVIRRYLINVKNKSYLFAKKSWVHGKIYDELRYSDVTSEKEISKILNKLRYIRNQADYDGYVGVSDFVEFLDDNKKELEIVFDVIDYFKTHPNY